VIREQTTMEEYVALMIHQNDTFEFR